MPQGPQAATPGGRPRRTAGRWLALLLPLALAAGAAALLPVFAPGAQAQVIEPTATPSTILRIEPPTQNVTAGNDVLIELRADGVANLGAYEFELNYFDSTLDFVSVTNSSFLGSTGRSVFCLNPVVDVGKVRYGCVTIGGGGGPTGSNALLATLRFSTSCDGPSPFNFSISGLGDTLGHDIPNSPQNGSVTVTGGGVCPTPTATNTPTETPTPGPQTPTPTPTATLGGPTATPSPLLCGPPAGVTLCVLPNGQSVSSGDIVTVQVAIDNATNLGAFQLALAFNDALLAPIDLQAGPFLGSTFRSVVCLPSSGDTSMQITCTTLGSGTPGPDGNGVIAIARFLAVDLVAGTSPVNISGSLARINGQPLAISTIIDGSVTVLGPPTPSWTPTSSNTPTITNTPSYTPTNTPCPVEGCPPTNTPTNTRTPTNTPTITNTPTQTNTPTITPTSTPGPCGNTSTPTLCIQPVTQQVFNGSDTTIDVMAAAMTGLGAFQFTVVTDPDITSVVGATVGPFLGSTFRTVTCFQPDPQPGLFTFVCNTLGNNPPGPDGGGKLATITLHGNGNGLSPITLQNVLLSRVNGSTLPPPGLGSGAITVVEAPTPTITLTPSLTPTPTITNTPTQTLTPTPCPTTGCPTATHTLTPSVTPTRTNTPTATFTPGPVTVRIEPTTQSIVPAQAMTVQVYVDNVVNLGAYGLTLSYNPALLDFQSAAAGPFLGSTGRSTFCVGPNETSSTVTIMCNSLGNAPAGPNGTGLLHTFNFTGRLIEGISPIHFQNAALSDITAGVIAPVLTFDGSVIIGVPPPTPTFTPTRTFTATPTITATPTASLTPTETPIGGGGAAASCADMDGNGRVLIGDILYVVQKYMTADLLGDLDLSGLVTISDILRTVDQYGDYCNR